MTVHDLDAVVAMEARAYGWPWSRGNFIDALAAGYIAEVLEGPDASLLGYFIAMPGVDELHLLNVTVAPEWQGRGTARRCWRRGGRSWPRPRPGRPCGSRCAGATTARAPSTRRRGFAEVGVRRGYYPAAGGAKTPW